MHDLDKLEMLVQAFEYEVAELQRGEAGGEGRSGQRGLDRFYESLQVIKDERVRAVVGEIMERRRRMGIGEGEGGGEGGSEGAGRRGAERVRRQWRCSTRDEVAEGAGPGMSTAPDPLIVSVPRYTQHGEEV